jgi:hypothetical protein
VGRSTPVGSTVTSRAPSARPASASALDVQTTARARRRIGRTSHGARRASSTSVPQSWTTYGFPVSRATSPAGSQCAWTRSASPAGGAREGGEEERQREREPRPAAQVADHTVPVGDPEVAETGRRDDLDLHSRRTRVLDRVADEVPRHVVRVPRIRRGQYDHLQRSLRAKTIGAASARVAKAKK